MKAPRLGKLPNLFGSMLIRTKILISNLFLIVLMAIAIGTLAIYAARSFTEIQTRDLTQQLVHQASDNIEYRAKTLVGSTVSLLGNNRLKSIVAGEPSSEEGNSASIRLRAGTLLSEFGNGNEYIRALIVRTSGGMTYWWENRDGGAGRMTELGAAHLAKDAEARLGGTSPHLLWSASPRDEDEILFARSFIDLSHVSRSYGVIVILLDSRYFWDLSARDSLILRENTAIIDESGGFITGGTYPKLREAVSLSEADRGGNAAFAESRIVTMQGSKYLVTQKKRSPDGWTIVCLIPMALLFGKIRLLQLVIVLITFAAVIVSAIVAVYLSKSTTRGIKMLERTMRRVEDGDFGVRIKPAGQDEAGVLALRFNTMLDRIDELIRTVYKERMEKQQAEFSVLLAQINPHFLYNSLGTIRWYANMKRQPEIERMTASLIGLLKSSVRKSSELHTLREELQDIGNYIDLQKIGYGDAFSVRYDVDESLMQYKVLHLTLQPLVENAILHGLEMSKGGGLITIRGWREAERLLLTVEDNGVGMEVERFNEMLAGPDRRSSYPGLHSIGIRGVHERIRLYFGEAFGLSYKSEPGKGTEAIVTLPAIEGAKGDEPHVESDDRRG
ncbi:sensor histidine kinase [Paenibacillus antri]|uniref:Sensor histidine kinase n=1 Tax=Paenibacillus antri TaxID=2582848 RepID=A0A5R9GHW5_9BACL|nr:sensor histidine kinase [Paenibacillus antri]TLS53840.1 sensor histidine kinase [Paenibacillus antri]